MKLIARKDGKTVGSVSLGENVIYIGRSKKTNLILPDSAVSRRHAKVYRQGPTIFLEDLKTTNGTYYEGSQIETIELHVGDCFQIGSFEIRLVEESSAEGTAAKPVGKIPAPQTTFTEAGTKLSPTDPPQEDFLDAIAVRPKASRKSAASGNMRVLSSFLENDPLSASDSLSDLEADEVFAREEASIDALPHESNARLVRLDGKDAGEQIPLDKDVMTLGRAKENDIIVDDESASPSHASIERENDSFFVRDRAESSGTFVDGVPVHDRELESHDIVHVGSSRFEFVQGTAQSRPQRPNVLERSAYASGAVARRPLAFVGDWRFLTIAGLAIGLLILLFTSKSPSVAPRPAPTAPTVDGEPERLTRFHLDRAAKHLQARRYDEAKSALRLILNSIAPAHPDAQRMLDEVTAAQRAEERQAEERRVEEERAARKIGSILREGKRLIAAGKYREARRIYSQALDIHATSREAKNALKRLDVLEEKAEARAETRRQQNAKLEQIYNQGVVSFEAGNLGDAKKKLSQVAAVKGNPYQASAKKLLAGIHKQVDREIDERLDNARVLMGDGELLKARTELLAIRDQFPDHKETQEMIKNVNARLLEKVKQVYEEGVAYLEIVEDREVAREKFEEVLRLAPNPKSEYHKKAKRKLRSLKSTSP